MKMGRAILASILFGTTIGVAQAADFCFKINNFVDVFRLNSTGNVIAGTDTAYYGVSGNNYQIPLVGGEASLLNPNPTRGYYGLTGVNGTRFFGGHTNCTFIYRFGSIDIPSMSISCDGGAPGTWTKTVSYGNNVSCTAPIPVSPPNAPAVGRCRSDPSPC
jgi:hypothetical protein